LDYVRWYLGERPHITILKEGADGLLDEDEDAPGIQAQLKHAIETEEKDEKKGGIFHGNIDLS